MFDIRFIGLVKTSNFTFDKFTVVKTEFIKVFLRFIQVKQLNFANFIILAKVFFAGGYIAQLCRGIPKKEGRIQVVAGLAPSSQTVGSLLRRVSPAKLAGKKWQKVNTVNSLQRRKYALCRKKSLLR